MRLKTLILVMFQAFMLLPLFADIPYRSSVWDDRIVGIVGCLFYFACVSCCNSWPKALFGTVFGFIGFLCKWSVDSIRFLVNQQNSPRTGEFTFEEYESQEVVNFLKILSLLLFVLLSIRIQWILFTLTANSGECNRSRDSG
jgi:hypothetical protein